MWAVQVLLELRILLVQVLLELRSHHSDILHRNKLAHIQGSTVALVHFYIPLLALAHKLDGGCHGISGALLDHILVEELVRKPHEEPGYILLLVLDCTLVLLLGEEHFYIPL